MSSIRPIRSGLLLRKIEEKEKVGGIYRVGEKEYFFGEVIKMGEGERDKDCKRIPMEVRIGDIVILNKNTVLEIIVDGVTYYISEDRYVIGIKDKEV
jgi:co-chaperonin GroES (HSP10)